MNKEEQQLEALNEIRKMMKDSSKFLSLSGLSGIFAGLYALTGAWMGTRIIQGSFEYSKTYIHADRSETRLKIAVICLAVLILSITTALILPARKARKNNQRLFDHTSKKVFWSMAVPLVAGGLLCISFLVHNIVMMVAPAMLLFYGLALLNSSKYTVPEIRFLAYLEVTIGILASFFPGHGLLFWAVGFGVLHIIYGAIMWNKYDRHNIN